MLVGQKLWSKIMVDSAKRNQSPNHWRFLKEIFKPSEVLTEGEGEGEVAVFSAKRWDRRSS